MSIYNKQYFIDKFSAIPSDDIGQGDSRCNCALYHCGVVIDSDNNYVMTDEANALGRLVLPVAQSVYRVDADELYRAVYTINDNAIHLGTTPRERILAALNLIPD